MEERGWGGYKRGVIEKQLQEGPAEFFLKTFLVEREKEDSVARVEALFK